MNVVWVWAADFVVLVHYVIMGYVLVGGYLAWHWPRTIALHVLAIVWAVLIVAVHVQCPLTALQNLFREQAGRAPLSGGFIDNYIRGTFYPTNGAAAAQAIAGGLVLVSWLGFGVHRHAHRLPGAHTGPVPSGTSERAW
jgi:Protein of Unknown function (DUF2784)